MADLITSIARQWVEDGILLDYVLHGFLIKELTDCANEKKIPNEFSEYNINDQKVMAKSFTTSNAAVKFYHFSSLNYLIYIVNRSRYNFLNSDVTTIWKFQTKDEFRLLLEQVLRLKVLPQVKFFSELPDGFFKAAMKSSPDIAASREWWKETFTSLEESADNCFEIHYPLLNPKHPKFWLNRVVDVQNISRFVGFGPTTEIEEKIRTDMRLCRVLEPNERPANFPWQLINLSYWPITTFQIQDENQQSTKSRLTSLLEETMHDINSVLEGQFSIMQNQTHADLSTNTKKTKRGTPSLKQSQTTTLINRKRFTSELALWENEWEKANICFVPLYSLAGRKEDPDVMIATAACFSVLVYLVDTVTPSSLCPICHLTNIRKMGPSNWTSCIGLYKRFKDFIETLLHQNHSEEQSSQFQEKWDELCMSSNQCNSCRIVRVLVCSLIAYYMKIDKQIAPDDAIKTSSWHIFTGEKCVDLCRELFPECNVFDLLDEAIHSFLQINTLLEIQRQSWSLASAFPVLVNPDFDLQPHLRNEYGILESTQLINANSPRVNTQDTPHSKENNVPFEPYSRRSILVDNDSFFALRFSFVSADYKKLVGSNLGFIKRSNNYSDCIQDLCSGSIGRTDLFDVNIPMQLYDINNCPYPIRYATLESFQDKFSEMITMHKQFLPFYNVKDRVGNFGRPDVFKHRKFQEEIKDVLSRAKLDPRPMLSPLKFGRRRLSYSLSWPLITRMIAEGTAEQLLFAMSWIRNRLFKSGGKKNKMSKLMNPAEHGNSVYFYRSLPCVIKKMEDLFGISIMEMLIEPYESIVSVPSVRNNKKRIPKARSGYPHTFRTNDITVYHILTTFIDIKSKYLCVSVEMVSHLNYLLKTRPELCNPVERQHLINLTDYLQDNLHSGTATCRMAEAHCIKYWTGEVVKSNFFILPNPLFRHSSRWFSVLVAVPVITESGDQVMVPNKKWMPSNRHQLTHLIHMACWNYETNRPVPLAHVFYRLALMKDMPPEDARMILANFFSVDDESKVLKVKKMRMENHVLNIGNITRSVSTGRFGVLESPSEILRMAKNEYRQYLQKNEENIKVVSLAEQKQPTEADFMNDLFNATDGWSTFLGRMKHPIPLNGGTRDILNSLVDLTMTLEVISVFGNVATPQEIEQIKNRDKPQGIYGRMAEMYRGLLSRPLIEQMVKVEYESRQEKVAWWDWIFGLDRLKFPVCINKCVDPRIPEDDMQKGCLNQEQVTTIWKSLWHPTLPDYSFSDHIIPGCQFFPPFYNSHPEFMTVMTTLPLPTHTHQSIINFCRTRSLNLPMIFDPKVLKVNLGNNGIIEEDIHRQVASFRNFLNESMDAEDDVFGNSASNDHADEDDDWMFSSVNEGVQVERQKEFHSKVRFSVDEIRKNLSSLSFSNSNSPSPPTE